MPDNGNIDLNGNNSFLIGSHRVGKGNPTFIIGEIAQAHDGSLGAAHAYIDAVAESGADAIKFQTHFADEESTIDEPFRIKFSKQDLTRYDYWKRMEFTKEQWAGLAKHCEEKGIIFLSTPFSVKAAEILRDIGISAWKIGSGEVMSEELLDEMEVNGSPILLSTGMSDFNEIEIAVSRIRAKKNPFAIFQCTTKYPDSLEEVGLNVIEELRNKYNCPVGLSDHTGSVFPALAAMAKGSNLIEVHVTFDKRMFGPDVIASITLDELKFIVEAKNAFYKMFNNPVDKNALAAELSETKALFSKSLAPRISLSKGTVLREDMVVLKKPGTGIPAHELKNIVGRRLIKDVTPKKLLRLNDLE